MVSADTAQAPNYIDKKNDCWFRLLRGEHILDTAGLPMGYCGDSSLN